MFFLELYLLIIASLSLYVHQCNSIVNFPAPLAWVPLKGILNCLMIFFYQVPSRSARRKKAKRQWLRATANIGKKKIVCRSKLTVSTWSSSEDISYWCTNTYTTTCNLNFTAKAEAETSWSWEERGHWPVKSTCECWRKLRNSCFNLLKFWLIWRFATSKIAATLEAIRTKGIW